MNKWGEESKLLNIKNFSSVAWEEEFMKNGIHDGSLMAASVLLISIYSILILGNCSPIHFRAASSGMGILCVILSTIAGYGLFAAFGLEATKIHNILPFMVLGIGVDDMFVIVNTID